MRQTIYSKGYNSSQLTKNSQYLCNTKSIKHQRYEKVNSFSSLSVNQFYVCKCTDLIYQQFTQSFYIWQFKYEQQCALSKRLYTFRWYLRIGHMKTNSNRTNHDNFSTSQNTNSIGSRARDYSTQSYNYGSGHTIHTGSRGGQYYIMYNTFFNSVFDGVMHIVASILKRLIA